MSEWISVQDRLPETKTTVVFVVTHPKYPEDSDIEVGYYTKTYGFDSWGTRPEDFSQACVTHWMPITLPPK